MSDVARQLGVAGADGGDAPDDGGDVLARLEDRLRPIDKYAVR